MNPPWWSLPGRARGPGVTAPGRSGLADDDGEPAMVAGAEMPPRAGPAVAAPTLGAGAEAPPPAVREALDDPDTEGADGVGTDGVGREGTGGSGTVTEGTVAEGTTTSGTVTDGAETVGVESGGSP